MSTFAGFSEEDLKRIKSGDNTGPPNVLQANRNRPGAKKNIYPYMQKKYQYKTITLQNQNPDDAIDDLQFDKCKLSIRSPVTTNDFLNNNDLMGSGDGNDNVKHDTIKNDTVMIIEPNNDNKIEELNNTGNENETLKKENVLVRKENDAAGKDSDIVRKDSSDVTPDIVRGVDSYTENDVSHEAKLEELQLKQKLMEEQNKRRKEMLSRALADRTRQTEEEVQKLEKIKKELQVLDGQFSQDVSVLRRKIDHACLSYSEAEKHYLRVEKEFLQAKIQLQKEKEKKELLTEHLCALITHNETRKAQKLETLMLELASNKTTENTVSEVNTHNIVEKKDNSIIVDGVDERTGKMVEMTDS